MPKGIGSFNPLISKGLSETGNFMKEEKVPFFCQSAPDNAGVKRLPKTKSGKILRGTIRRIVDGKKYTVPSTIDDAAVLKEIEKAVRETQQER